MTLVGLLLLFIVGAVCGGLAEFIVGFSPGGFFASAVVGFIGAWIGTWIAHATALPGLFAVTVEGVTIEVLWAVIGAVLLLVVLSMFRRARTRRFYSDY